MMTAPAWSLVTFTEDATTDRAGILRPDGQVVQPAQLSSYHGLIDAMRDWEALAPQLRAISPADLPAISGAKLVAPLRYPNKLLCAGANYHDHIAEMGKTEVPEGTEPFFFLLPPSTTLLPSGKTVDIPADPQAQVDWEAELAVIIGARASNVSRQQAPNYVAGYAAFNDVTARGYLHRQISLAPPFAFDWLGAKGLDGFCPIGPITPAWQIADPHALRIRCTIDGVVKQDGRTSTMIFDIWDLIAAASRRWTLEPGDILATGTPAGVGVVSKTFLKGGEEVVVEVEGCARLISQIRMKKPSAAA